MAEDEKVLAAEEGTEGGTIEALAEEEAETLEEGGTIEALAEEEAETLEEGGTIEALAEEEAAGASEEEAIEEAEAAGGELGSAEGHGASRKGAVRQFLSDERGIGVIEIVLILVILIGLVLLFKTQITDLVTSAFGKITSDATSILK